MTALEYLDSLIEGVKVSVIPPQPVELQLLRQLMVKEAAERLNKTVNEKSGEVP